MAYVGNPTKKVDTKRNPIVSPINPKGLVFNSALDAALKEILAKVTGQALKKINSIELKPLVLFEKITTKAMNKIAVMVSSTKKNIGCRLIHSCALRLMFMCVGPPVAFEKRCPTHSLN